MSNINAQTIINEVLAAHAIAPEECTWGKCITFKTSERGTHRILNCRENLQRFADLVRKNAAAFGGGLIREEKQKPAIVWPSKSIALFKQCIEDNDYQAAFDIGTGKLGALFFVDNKGAACMQVAPIPLDSEPRLVSMLNENGKWSVCCPVSMLGLDALTGNKRSRQAQIDVATDHLRLMKPEKKEAMMANAHARQIDQSAIRAKWMREHGIVDDAAIEARIEANAAQDVAQIVAQAVAVSAIADAMAHEAEDAQELVTCEAGESEANTASTASMGNASGFTVAAYNTVTAMLASFTPTVPPFGGNAGPCTPSEVSKEYRYAMVNRPFSIGTAPKDGFIRMDARPENDEPHHAMARHGIAVYDRQLTDKETLDYEMAPIADDAMLADICANVCADMIEYADGYIEMASSTWLDFQSHVTQALNRITKSYRVSLCTYELSQMVVNALTCQQEKCKALPTTVAVSGEPPTPRPMESTNFAADIPLSLAVSAFGGVSMSPERRGANAQAEYAQGMAEDYETMRIQAVKGGTLDLLPEVFARYRGRQAGAFRAYLASSSRCVSSFIAGPSNFPAARMNKRNDIAHKRLNDYLDGGKDGNAIRHPRTTPRLAGDHGGRTLWHCFACR